MSRIDKLKAQIAQIDGLIAAGTLTGEDARKARQKLEQELLALLVKGGQPGANGPAAAAPAAAAAVAVSPSARPSRRLVATLVVFVVLFGAAGYAWLGNREGLAVEPGSPGPAAETAHSTGPGQIEAMAERLAQRLKDKPDDAEGWAMLGRSYSVLGRHKDALPAYQRVIDLRPQDAQAYADYADALGSANGRSLEGEPEKFIEKALKLDPDNLKALALAGSLAFNRGDAATAARYWEHAVRKAEPGSELGKQLQAVLDEARQRAGMTPLPAASAPPAQVAAATTPQAAAPQAAAPKSAGPQSATPQAAGGPGAGAVQGRVSLAKALQGQVAPGDTLFVFARPAQGSRMPLAILRKQVKDLPFEFTLDDSLAMSPEARMSAAGQVIVGARISKSGNAMPQPGDLQVLSQAIAVGTRGLQLEIVEGVR